MAAQSEVTAPLYQGQCGLLKQYQIEPGSTLDQLDYFAVWWVRKGGSSPPEDR